MAKEDDELREEALAEWVSRGRAAQDFSMDKMIKLWDQEDDGDGDDDEEDLTDKQELLKGMHVMSSFINQTKEAAQEFKEKAKVEGKKALAAAKKYAELPPLRRRRLLRQHVANVHEMDKDTQKYSSIRQRVIDEFQDANKLEEELHFGLKKRNIRRAPLLNRSQQLKAEADRIQQEKIADEIDQKRRERMEKILQEKQRLQEEKELRTEQRLKQRRQMNLNFWQKQLIEAREFAEQQRYEQQKDQEFHNGVLEMKQEIQAVAEEAGVDATEGLDRLQTSSSIGIFDTAFEPGEWNSAIDGGHRTGLDEHTVGVSITRGFKVENEQKRLELMEMQSKVLMLREKLEQTEAAKNNLGLDMRLILERKDRTLQEIRQVKAEQDDLNDALAGPPRRDSSEKEKQQFHTLVTRRADYMKQLGDLDSRIANIQKRTAIVQRSEASFLPMLQVAEQKLAKLQTEVDTMEKERHDLPVVVGKAIFHPEGPVDGVDGADSSVQITTRVADPTKLLNQVTMESKFEILKSAVAPVNEHYKKAKRHAIESWKMNELRSLAEQELDDSKARLIKVRDRYTELQNTSLRSDIVHAIQKYHQDGNKLRQCIFPLKGQIEWWGHQMPKKSMGLAYSVEHNTIFLAEGQMLGKISGCIHLPKRCFYKIQVHVAVRKIIVGDSPIECEKESSGEMDEVTAKTEDWKLYVGPEMDSLQHHTFRDLGGKILRTGDLFFEFSGFRFCFCLEISHRGVRNPKRKQFRYEFSNVGKYEERLEDFREEDNRVRLLQKEKHFVSELVKTMRMQAKQTSSQRATELLQELIQVEKSRTKMWDSSLFHGHSQRFKRADYVAMLRGEIKKEIAVQIDYGIAFRQGRVSESDMMTAGTPVVSDTSLKGKRKEASRMDFQTRKSALLEPKRLAVQKFIGDYCSFKSQQFTAKEDASYRKEAMVMGVRYEWREARTKLHVMHKLCGPPKASGFGMTTEWHQLENANAIFLASSCVKVLRRSRTEEAEARVLMVAKDAKIERLQQETQKHVDEENEAVIREAKEDELLSHQMQHELERREKLFYADAIRLATYNENVSSQIDFQVQRKANALAHQQEVTSSTLEPIITEVKEAFAKQFVQGKLALVKKTWERKANRVMNKRVKDRKEREFRIKQEQNLVKEINETNEHEMAELKAEQRERARGALRIPNFDTVVQQNFDCEHLELKAWGTKYDFGLKCKQCGKEMSKSFDDPDHIKGGDADLDDDVRIHRAQEASGIAFRFRSSEHLQKVENERLRLEKEARVMGELESMMYDRVDPKSIDEFNYRHGINRGTILDQADSSDPLHHRLVQDIHRAAHQDELLFHGRLRNFNFRIQQISKQHADCIDRLSMQRVFLENVQHETKIVLKKLPLIEADHARTVAMLEEDAAAFKSFEKAKRRLTAAQAEREAAHHAIEGVEEEAEFSEFHAPALIKSSDEMSAVFKRLQEEFKFVTDQMVAAKEKLSMADTERSKVDQLISRLHCRTQNSVLRTKFGFVKVNFFREEDNCVVVTPLHWSGTIFIPVNDILEYEAIYREEEMFVMADEDEQGHKFVRMEQKMEALERERMRVEEEEIRVIMAWRRKKVEEEELLSKTICRDELESQFVYETENRLKSIQAARQEAMRLQRRGRMYPPRKRRPLTQRPNKLDVKRVTRASEKRLAMAAIEQSLLAKEKQLRSESEQERNAISVKSLSQGVFEEIIRETIESLCGETIQQVKYEAQEFLHKKSNAILLSSDGSESISELVRPLLGLDRLWIARKAKYNIMHQTWRKEFAKLQLVREEMARREELRRLAEEERLRLEARRKEMLAEERLCRRFYLEESVLYMQERKAMASAEVEMREYIRQLELEAMKTKYSKMLEDRNRVNDKAARRLEIKHGKNEQHRLHREWRQIKEEDELSMKIRENELADALAEALDRQFGKYLADQALQGKLSAEMEARQVAERLREAQQVAAEKRKVFEVKMVQEKMIATVETFYVVSRAEVQWMDAVERAAYWEKQAPLLDENLKRMEPELQRILKEREHVVNDASAKREYAEKCKKRIAEADTSLSSAIQEKEKAMLKYKRVHKLNVTIDSEVLHDRVQRFRTAYLRDRLHSQYFALLTESIIRRALVESTEREIVRLEDKIRRLDQERKLKSKEVSVLQRKRRRALRMRFKRSELNKLMFGRSRQRLLKEMFYRWTKLWSERARVRTNFKLKHELLLQKQKLAMTTSSPLLKQENLLREMKAVSVPTRLTILHDHQKRVLQCRLCRQKYSEEQNNRYSCTYHPGTYEFAFVKTCETRRHASSSPAAVPASCMMHRAKRWLCCDETEEGRYGSSGCTRRFHMPARNNPELEDLVATKSSQEQTLLDQINQQLLELRERNVVGKMKFATKAIVSKMEQDLSNQRATAAKFHTLDRRS